MAKSSSSRVPQKILGGVLYTIHRCVLVSECQAYCLTGDIGLWRLGYGQRVRLPGDKKSGYRFLFSLRDGAVGRGTALQT